MNKNLQKILKQLSYVLVLFLIVLTVFIGVKVKNEVEKGNFIGEEIKNDISFSGTGKVYAKPDLAVISFSVVSQKKTVEEALNDNSSKMNSVIEKMKSIGLEEKDLKTTRFNIRPRYEYRDDSDAAIYPPSGKRVLVGYEVDQTLETKIRKMEKIGEIIDEATKSGANEVNSFNLTIEDKEELRKEARKEAIENAKEKAANLADQLGVKLGKIVNFNEQTSTPRYYNNYDLAAAKEMKGSSSPQIETGENKIEVSVSISYEIDSN